MIYSPHCPVFRRDDGTLLEQPYFVDFITAPAPNAGAVRQNQPSLAAQIEGALRERAAKSPGLAAHHRCDVLVLGAWGCGVFRNEWAMEAVYSVSFLCQMGAYWDVFGKGGFCRIGKSVEPRDLPSLPGTFCGLMRAQPDMKIPPMPLASEGGKAGQGPNCGSGLNCGRRCDRRLDTWPALRVLGLQPIPSVTFFV